MIRKFGLYLGIALALAACGTGWPWGRNPDLHAAGTAAAAAPLIAACQQRFAASLAPAALVLTGGPSVTRIGDRTTIHLTAEPVSGQIDDQGFWCDFDGASLNAAQAERR